MGTRHPDGTDPAVLLTRRLVLGMGGLLGIAALAGCAGGASSSSGPSSSGSSSSGSGTTSTGASGGTDLAPGSVTATFSSSAGGPGGGSGTQKMTGAYLVDGVDARIDGGSWQSTSADQNVFLVVNGGSLTLSNATVTKVGDSSNEEACNFYGLNSAVLVVGEGSTATLTNCTVTTAAEGANAVFAASSAAIGIEGITIRTSGNSSRGLDATYGGSVTAKDVDIETTGAHCACLATDRGNGTIAVSGASTLTSSGDGSPLVYSTGDISVKGASGTASGAQTMVIEGKNSISIEDCTFTTSGTQGMMIYQSFSGDAADSDATASSSSMAIKRSTVTATADQPMIYVTNTTCEVSVTSSTLEHSSGTLMALAEDRWGASGSNGGHATVTVADCTLDGALTAGGSSSAKVALTKGSTLKGGISGSVTVTPDGTSTWTR